MERMAEASAGIEALDSMPAVRVVVTDIYGHDIGTVTCGAGFVEVPASEIRPDLSETAARELVKAIAYYGLKAETHICWMKRLATSDEAWQWATHTRS